MSSETERASFYFNSTKVQFGAKGKKKVQYHLAISIPLRYNLESRLPSNSRARSTISIPLRYNLEGLPPKARTVPLRDFNSTKVQFGESLADRQSAIPPNFNSTKVQFGAVKLDRKYHINKGFERRFR